jgi:hypothetical protein
VDKLTGQLCGLTGFNSKQIAPDSKQIAPDFKQIALVFNATGVKSMQNGL